MCADDLGLYVFQRYLPDEEVTVVLNASPEERELDLPTLQGAFLDLLNEEDVLLTPDSSGCQVRPLWARILLRR